VLLLEIILLLFYLMDY